MWHCQLWRCFFICHRKEFLMEVKINREIRNYTESMFFGLSLRQFIFSVLACGVAVGLYFLLKPHIGTETVSWVCILGAAPFAALGFVKYNGMTAEKFIWAWIKSEFLMPKKLVFHSTNTYLELMKPSIVTGNVSVRHHKLDPRAICGYIAPDICTKTNRSSCTIIIKLATAPIQGNS